MAFAPKPFQQEALDRLRRFLGDCRLTGDPAAAFQRHVKPRAGEPRKNYRPLTALPLVPSVCLRLPTGGGKTLLGAMAVGTVAQNYLEREFPLVLWLVPSDAIRTQTLKAFRDPDHPYRQQLGEPFGGRVRVFDMTEFANLRPQDLRANLCVVVGTMQTLRVTNTEGRRVYAHNENLEDHFNAETLQTPGLELIDEGLTGAGTPRFSFANLLKVQRPLVILDEAHQFVTELAEEVRRRIGPGVVVELTATPPAESNVLDHATAAELKAADMIKLPVVLTEHNTDWRDAVNEAIRTRKKLASLAIDEPEPLRPILLIQTQNAGGEADWKAVRQYLVETAGLAEAEIAVHTGDRRDLDGVDLFSPACPVTTILTVRALMEGWDCSFAYVLCSTANIGQPRDVEQLLGRVLRMPYARRRANPELNKAYAHVTSARFGEAARTLRDSLVGLGLERVEADAAIEVAGRLPLFEERPLFFAVLERRPDLSAVPAEETAAMQVQEVAPGAIEVRVVGPVGKAAASALLRAAPSRERVLREAIDEHNAAWAPTPEERGVVFQVPRLTIEAYGQRVLFDAETVAEIWDWDLSDHPADLSDFRFDETTRTYTLDLEGETFRLTALADSDAQLPWLASELTPQRLVEWLDPKLRDASMNQTVLASWLLRAVETLLERPGFSIEVLDRGRFILLRKLESLLAVARAEEAAKGYQTLLFGENARGVTDDTFAFAYGSAYPATQCYRGAYRFRKHYYGCVGELKDEGEEFDCAMELDRLEDVKHWVRNLAGRGHEAMSFWLQTATDRFYPDFVAALNDGRVFAVEYKGDTYRTNDDSREKNALGELWADRSGGRALFAMVERQKRGMNMKEQLMHALKQKARGLG